MSEEKISIDQYGRRHWNVEAYAEEAKDRKSKGKHRSSHLSGAAVINDEKSSSSYIKHRDTLLKESLGAVKTYNLISPAASATTGRRFGFFCPVCTLSFRDNLALIDHFNSPQHVAKANAISREAAAKNKKEGVEQEEESVLEGGIRRATLNEVIATLESLVQKHIKNRNSTPETIQFSDRVKKRQEFEEKMLETRRRKRAKMKLKSQKAENQQEESNMAAMMGFSDFGSGKK
ncbi:U4/U6.U5 snRNP associated protein [Scheffersomyces stipitis CBS 6054]|uniref:U4/U6.U5 snRNP associated protein n=1 Tax=Scheffersomyces stipitis (strain ATCC 58785 / CBS 6054 / NBRC 10063 / NRRL Y-11545) TaxID=322104 RepID=A3LUL7_PICST|nr:U4/U6.U5 snRNP associated protein [Scheffersomyces stipitis CBS 6054]ABN66614.2 U4/U6.U5 snRNP associated protein [Scheffersomyces stipitis CBS 6054]